MNRTAYTLLAHEVRRLRRLPSNAFGGGAERLEAALARSHTRLHAQRGVRPRRMGRSAIGCHETSTRREPSAVTATADVYSGLGRSRIMSPGSQGDVADYTGAHTRKRQIAVLRANGVRHIVNAAGWPVVAWATEEEGAIPEHNKAHGWKPNKAA